MMRRVIYVSGTRADFGLMRRTLDAIYAEPRMSLSILVTGMHLSPLHGETIREIEASRLPILACVPVSTEPATGATMARGIGTMVEAFTNVLEASRPDIVLLLGDRGEMLAGAIAALHLNIAVAHIHGGERSGTVDEPVRHAISKLSHLHLTATDEARDRLVRMGENPAYIHVTGAPGIDGLTEAVRASREQVAARYHFDPSRPLALMVYHPVLQSAEAAGEEARMILNAVIDADAQVLVLMPNSDAGSDGVRRALEAQATRIGVALTTHLERESFLEAMARFDLMIGNSSAGIIEAASFGTPVVNVGSRQELRLRNLNVIDVPAESGAVHQAVKSAVRNGRLACCNLYGDGRAATRIVAALRDTPLDMRLMTKINAY